jgi:metal-sulfur cluster biosynthetic enzyme
MPAPASHQPNIRLEAESDPLTIAVWEAVNRIKDPCHALMGHDVSIVDLGLINRVDLVGDCLEVGITFTDTSCTFAYKIINALEDLAPTLPGVSSVKVTTETYPLWTEARLSPRARAFHARTAKAFGLSHRELRADAASSSIKSNANDSASEHVMRSETDE